MSPGFFAFIALVGLKTATASFNFYSTYETPVLAELYGISEACITALNETVQCDAANALRAGGGVDEDYWYKENITTLCTSTCRDSLMAWNAAVTNSCGSQTMLLHGALVEAKLQPAVYQDSFNLACVQDSARNWCFFESQEWQGSDYIRYAPDICDNDDGTNPPECDDPDFTPMEITADMMALTNLYDEALYCNECFLLMMKQRLSSPFLSESNHTNYLVEQFESLQKNCSTTMTYTTTKNTMYLGIATATATSTASSASLPTSCSQDQQPVNASSPNLPCEVLAKMYNVSTGAAILATNDLFCQFNETICLPLPCEIEKIYNGTCQDLARGYSTTNHNVTTNQLLGWNTGLQGSCDGLYRQIICKSPPGGRYQASKSIYAPTAAGSYYATATPTTPSQPGAIDACGLFYTVAAGDTCNGIVLRFGISFDDLRSYNTEINGDCTNLWLGYSVCVAPVSKGPSSTNGLCGPDHDFAVCEGSGFGSCCSSNGFCGNGAAYCASNVCISGACSAGGEISVDGTCSKTVGCTGSGFGACCSTSGYCGSGEDWCGPGNCISGNCDPDTGGKSLDGACGPLFAGNKTCTGTQFGACCSTSGYCGDTADYCSAGSCYSGACQK